MNKIKILVDGMCPDKGGVQEYLINLYRNIDYKKYEFHFIICGNYCIYEEEILKLGGKIKYITPRNKNVFKNIYGYYKIMKKKSEYKAIYYNLSCLYYIVPFLFGILNKKNFIITHSHNSTEKSNKTIKYNLYKYLHIINRNIVNKYSDKKCMCSTEAGRWLFGSNMIKKGEVEFIANAVNLEKFKIDDKKRNELRNNMKLNGKFVMGNVGRFSYQKNHDFLIDIYIEINKIYKDTVLVLVGDGELKIDIIQKVKNNKIEDKVMFLGEIDNVNDIMQAIDVLIMPSRFEGLSIVLIEAQSLGLKLFVSDSITNEAKITSNIEYINIDQSPEYWAKRVLEVKNYKRRNMDKEIIKSGFEIVEMAKSFEKNILS